MKDRRLVDDLSLKELERILLIKRREARLARLRQIDRRDQVVGRDPLEPATPFAGPPPISTAYREFQGMGASADFHAIEVIDNRQRSLRLWLSRRLSPLLRINWRFILNRILLLIEMTAVVGLVIIVLNTIQSRERIDDRATPSIVPPTPTAAPLINAVVLPGGHTPPDARGFAQPEQLPEDLQRLAQAITPQPLPTRGPEHATRIVIPSIGVNHPVVEGDDWQALKQGVGHTPWSANPGEVGNCVLSAFNDIFGEIFRRLPEVELGDRVFIHTGNQMYRYIVKATHVVDPVQVDLMMPADHPLLTLVSSYPYLVDDRRIVVVAELDSS